MKKLNSQIQDRICDDIHSQIAGQGIQINARSEKTFIRFNKQDMQKHLQCLTAYYDSIKKKNHYSFHKTKHLLAWTEGGHYKTCMKMFVSDTA